VDEVPKDASVLSTAIKMGVPVCEEIISAINESETNHVHAVSVMEILERSKAIMHIVTFCQPLDNLMKGGVPLGEITEFCKLSIHFFFNRFLLC
jgi:hypothetical protein